MCTNTGERIYMLYMSICIIDLDVPGEVGTIRGSIGSILTLFSGTVCGDEYRVETRGPKPVHSTGVLSVLYRRFLYGTQLTTSFVSAYPWK